MHALQTSRTARAVALIAIAASTLLGQLISSSGAAHAAGAGTSHRCVAAVSAATRVGKFGGIQRPSHAASSCGAALARTSNTERPYESGSTPPLRYGTQNTAPVMATDPNTPLTITPIFWQGSTAQGYSFSQSYVNLILRYLADVSHDSGTSGNLYSTLTQYYMNTSSGKKHINYNFTLGTGLLDQNTVPTTCTVNGGSIYHDGSHYKSCVADIDIANQVKAVVTGEHLPTDMNHLYPIFLPKHVEVCFSRNNPSYQQCTVNHTKSAAFCAYHSYAKTAPKAVYAAMPFPVYGSSTGYTCSSEYDAPGIQSPNNQMDADVDISSLSHEMSEAITDPHLDAWSAIDGNENGDLCSSEYGTFTGPRRAKWNQTINGHHYLTQEEFSNKEFVKGKGGCVQDENVPTVTSVTAATGSRGRTVTVHGSGFRPGKTTVNFGSTPGTNVTITGTSTTSLTVKAPTTSVGAVDVTVHTPNGTSGANESDVYYDARPTITGLDHNSGPASGGDTVTITGTNFSPYTTQNTVTFGGVAAQVVSGSDTSLVVTTPSHATGTVGVAVQTLQGTGTKPQAYSYQ